MSKESDASHASYEQYRQRLIQSFRENFPVLYHGTTSFDSVETSLTIKGAFTISSREIHASHNRPIAANYAAIVKDHPHMSGALPGIDGPLHFVVIDDKEDYLQKLTNRRKLLLSFSNEAFTPIPFGLNTVAEWRTAEDAIVVAENIHEYAHFDDVLADGAQIFFTRGTTNHEEVRYAFQHSRQPNWAIGYMVTQGKLEWANLERGINPALEFQKH